MRILIVETFSGSLLGAQKVTNNLMSCLNDEHEVLVISKDDSSTYKDFEKYDYIGRLPLLRVMKSVYGKGDMDTRRLDYMDYIKIGLSSFASGLYLIWKVVKHKPDVIYTYDPRGIMLSGLAALFFKKKFIWHLHGSLNYGDRVNNLFCKLPSKIIVPSKSIEKSISECHRNKVKVIYNGYDFRRTSALSRQKNNIIFVGSLVPHKGLHNIILALNDIQDREIILNIVGDFICEGWYKDYIHRLCSDVHGHRVVFHGWVSDATKIIECSSLLCFASIEDGLITYREQEYKIKSSEALPTVLIESLSFSVPVVASITNGVEEIICKKEYGILIDRSCPYLISKSITIILENYDDYKIDSNEVRKKFGLSSFKSSVDKIFGDLDEKII